MGLFSFFKKQKDADSEAASAPQPPPPQPPTQEPPTPPEPPPAAEIPAASQDSSEDIAAALAQIGSFVSDGALEEETPPEAPDEPPAPVRDPAKVYVPADQLLPLFPPECLAGELQDICAQFAADPEFCFIFERSELLYGLSLGKLEFAIGDLVGKAPANVFSNDAQAFGEQPLEVPLGLVVPLVPPDWLVAPDQDTSKVEVLESMGDVFEHVIPTGPPVQEEAPPPPEPVAPVAEAPPPPPVAPVAPPQPVQVEAPPPPPPVEPAPLAPPEPVQAEAPPPPVEPAPLAPPEPVQAETPPPPEPVAEAPEPVAEAPAPEPEAVEPEAAEPQEDEARPHAGDAESYEKLSKEVFAGGQDGLGFHVKDGEAVAPTGAASDWSSQAPNGVNVNTCLPSELIGLSGVGHHMAKLIIDYREEHGPFKELRDLIKVTGLGSYTYRNITGLGPRADLRQAELQLNRVLDIPDQAVDLGKVVKSTLRRLRLKGVFISDPDGLALARECSDPKIAPLADNLCAASPQLFKLNQRSLRQARLPSVDMFTCYLGRHAVTFAGSESVACICIHSASYPSPRQLRDCRRVARELVWYCSYRAVV